MSIRSENIKSLIGLDYARLNEGELSRIFNSWLCKGIHGICFSPYMEKQRPGSVISEAQIRERLMIIQPYTKWIRTFSCTDGNELIPKIARELGFKVMAGAWLGENFTFNEEEIRNLVKATREGFVDLVCVGNEVLYRDDLSEAELLEYIRELKKELPEIPIGYADAYYEFCYRPALTNACDVIFANCYPFWEGCHIEYSLLYMKDMYNRTLKAAKGKKVIISETGWPSIGSSFESSEPSSVNAITYFINAQKWSTEENIEIFYFSAFDELWKVSDEGDVGAYWGIWDKNGKLKQPKRY